VIAKLPGREGLVGDRSLGQCGAGVSIPGSCVGRGLLMKWTEHFGDCLSFSLHVLGRGLMPGAGR